MESEAADTTILRGSIKSASYQMVMQVFFLCMNFGLNAFVFGNADKAVLGIVNVRLMLLIMSILFISRESFRKACMNKTKDQNWPQVINLLWLTTPSMLMWSTIFCYIWLNVLQQPAEEHIADYRFTVYVVGISCVFESFMEPLHIFAKAFLYAKLRLCLDLSILAIRMGIFAITVLYYPEYIIKSAAFGQAFSSICYVVVHWIFFWNQFRQKAELMKNREQHKDNPLLALPFNSLRDFLPRKIEGKSFIERDMISLNWGFFKQGILKHVLTEGGSYVMTAFSTLTFAEQGVFNLVNSLGSRSARFLLMPIEESGYFYFAQMTNRQIPVEERPRKEVEQVSVVMYRLLRSLTLMSMMMIVFGSSFAHLILLKYGGSSLADGVGPWLLRAHSVCVWFMAINGVTEAFVFASMKPDELDKRNRKMVVLSFVYIGSAWLLSRAFGGVGFILANIINNGSRIALSIRFIKSYYQKLGLDPISGVFPFKLESAVLLLAFVVTTASSWLIYPTSATSHAGIGVVSWLVVVASILYCDTAMTSFLSKAIKKRLGKTD